MKRPRGQRLLRVLLSQRVRTAAAATAVVTAAVVGSSVNTLPPAGSVVVVNGFTYPQCGSTWYQPQIAGGSTTYVVVNLRCSYSNPKKRLLTSRTVEPPDG